MNLKLFKPIVMMQLKEKIDLSYLKSKKQTIANVVFGILKFVMVVVFAYLLFSFSRDYNVFSLIRYVPVSVVTVIFAVMFTLSTITCTFSLMQNLYFAKDNAILLTFPVTPNQVFLSKLIVFYIYELKKNITFLVPMFIGYGLITGFPILYYLWLLVAFVFISALSVSIGALLSIPFMVVAQFLKQRKYLQVVLFAGIMVGVFYLLIKIIALIPANINIIGTWGTLFWQIQDFLNAFIVNFKVFYDLVIMITGTRSGFIFTSFSQQTFITFGILVFTIISILGLSFLLTRPLFFKMASTPFEYKKNAVLIPKNNKVRSKFISSLRKEFIINLRTPDLLFSNFSVFAMLPIAIFLLNKIYSAMNTGLLGQYMTLSFNVLIILLILLSTNSIVASAYSKEGGSSYLIKTKPATYHISLLAKLIFNLCLMTLSLVMTMVIFKITNNLPIGDIILFFFAMLFIYVGHLFWSAEMDIMNPQTEQYATTGGHSNNPNENKSNLFAFLLAFLFFIVSLLLFTEGITVAWIKVMCIALAFMIARIYLFFAKVQVYYKEV